MSNLSVGSISGLATNNNVISVTNGHTLRQAGMNIQASRVLLTGTGSITSTSGFTTISDSSNSMSISFAPKVANSLIYIEWMLQGVDNGNICAWVAPFRDSNSLYTGNSTGMISGFNYGDGWKYTYGTSSDSNLLNTFSGHFWDVAGSTASRTYSLRLKTRSGPFYINRTESDSANQDFSTRGCSSFTVMEIAQ